MISLLPEVGSTLDVLCIGAHADDVEIGTLGTLLTLAARYELRLSYAIGSASTERRAEAETAITTALPGVSPRLLFGDLRESHFPYIGAEPKAFLAGVHREVDPHVVLTHSRHDYHQDHRVLSELTLNEFRDHLILEYEIPKWDGDLGRPNVYVPLTDDAVDRKIEVLATSFPSQSGKDWFDERVFRGLMRIRGMECRAASGYAEAFTLRKALVFV